MKPLDQFVQKDSALGRLRVGARQLEALTRRIRTVIPAEARDHVIGCAPRPGAIVVLADTAAWAAQLRYLQNDILTACRRELGERIDHVRFKVLPRDSPAEKHPAPDLSKNTRRLLRGTASGIADDALAAALRQLSDSGDQDAD